MSKFLVDGQGQSDFIPDQLQSLQLHSMHAYFKGGQDIFGTLEDFGSKNQNLKKFGWQFWELVQNLG